MLPALAGRISHVTPLPHPTGISLLLPSLALHFLLNGGSAIAQDTAGVLRAVAAQMAIANATEDSTRRASCSENPTYCRREFPHRPVWYADTGATSAPVAERLARYDSTEFIRASRLPPCPWPATAPRRAGYRAGADITFSGDGTATVQVRLRCDNPPGYMHDIFSFDRTYRVVRKASGWYATLEVTRIT